MIDYSKYLNREIQVVKPSGIRKFFDIANEMEDVISLSVGEPDFHTPWHIGRRALRAWKRAHPLPTPNRGFLQLRQEIANFLARHYSVEYQPDQEILVTVGAAKLSTCACGLSSIPGRRCSSPSPALCATCPSPRWPRACLSPSRQSRNTASA